MCKNNRGLKIHQAKVHKQEQQQQRTTLEVDKAEEIQNPEENQSVHDHQAADERQEERVLLKSRVKWPASKEDCKWKDLEEDLIAILNNSMNGAVKDRIQTFTKMIYTVSKDRFGVKENTAKKEVTNKEDNRRGKRKREVRKELKALTKRWKESSEQERGPIDQLRGTLRKKLENLSQAERLRNKRKLHRKAKEQFTNDPFKYTSELLGKEKNGNLTCNKREVQEYLANVHNDDRRDEPLFDMDNIEEPHPPTVEFALGDITWKEVEATVKKARSKSAPGPSGITYQLYKKCPRLLKILWRQLVVVWRKGVIPDEWTKAEGCFVPKEANSSTINQFRTISLLDVEGKIYFSILAKRMTSFMINNNYIDTSTQKGGVGGFPGCWEHNSMITQLLKEAKEKRGNITLVWLDLANAYGSVPHSLVMLALQKYHVPGKVQDILKNYLDKLSFRFTTNSFTTNWQRLEKGIITGCTISVIVFIAAINIMIKTAEKECRGPKLNDKQQKPLKAFMDDLTISTVQPQGARWVLRKLEELTKWARMAFKPSKCRSIVIQKGTIEKNVRLKLGTATIPSLNEQPVKCLGKWYDGSLRDTENSRKTIHQLQDHLERVDKAPISGRYRAWIFQHGVMPRLTWPMLMYNISMTRVEEMERKASKYLRKWLGVPQSFSSVGLYSKSSMLQLPLASVKEEYKVARVRGQVMLDESNDVRILESQVKLKQSGRWSVQRSIDEARNRILHKELVGTVRQGRRGLDVTDRVKWAEASKRQRRSIIQTEVGKRRRTAKIKGSFHVRTRSMDKVGMDNTKKTGLA